MHVRITCIGHDSFWNNHLTGEAPIGGSMLRPVLPAMPCSPLHLQRTVQKNAGASDDIGPCFSHCLHALGLHSARMLILKPKPYRIPPQVSLDMVQTSSTRILMLHTRQSLPCRSVSAALLGCVCALGYERPKPLTTVASWTTPNEL
jgi:hypothetical protein